MGLLSNRLTGIKTGTRADDLARHSLLMVIFGAVGSFFSYLYQLSMGMLLTPAQYGTLLSFTSLFTIIAILSQSVQISVARFTSRFKAENKLGGVNYLWKSSLKKTLLFGLLLFTALILFAPLLSRFLHTNNNWYAIILFASLLLAFALPANWGLLQGLQRFFPLGLSQALWSFLRVFIGTLLVYFGLGIYGGLLSFPLAYLIVFLLTLFFLRDLTKLGNEKLQFSQFSSYTGSAFLAILSFAVLTNIDIALAKHYLAPEHAGNYGVISVLGKIALYAPVGVATALFPKSAEFFDTGMSQGILLRKAIWYTFLITGVISLIYWLFPELVVGILFGGKYPLAAPYLVKYGLAMGLFAFAYLLMNHLLSLNRTRVAYSLLVAMLLQLGLITFFHADITVIINVMLISSLMCLALMLPLYFTMRQRKGEPIG
jgi:O-antigen/teichoic acid export membrane protein